MRVVVYPTLIDGSLLGPGPPASQPPLSQNPRPPERITIDDPAQIQDKKINNHWHNISILGSLLYPYLANTSNWKKEKFMIKPDPWCLSIRNSKKTDIIDRGLVFLGHYMDKDFTLNTKSHIILYRKKSEHFTFISCSLRCIQVGAHQILIELRANGMHLGHSPNYGITTDIVRDCIL